MLRRPYLEKFSSDFVELELVGKVIPRKILIQPQILDFINFSIFDLLTFTLTLNMTLWDT